MIGEIETCAAASAGRVVQSVADHQHAMALRFQLFDLGDLFRRLEPGLPVRDSELLRYRRNGGRPVARQYDEIESALAQRVDHRDRVRPQRLPDGDGDGRAVMSEGDEGRIAAVRRMRGVCNAAEVGAAETRFLAVDDGAHALPRLLDCAGIGTAHARQPGKRGRERMVARQREPRRLFQNFGRDAGALIDARLGQRQTFRSCRTRSCRLRRAARWRCRH